MIQQARTEYKICFRPVQQFISFRVSRMPRSTKTEAILSYTVTMKNKQEGPTGKGEQSKPII